MRRIVTFLALVAALVMLLPATALAVSGAGYTTVDPAADGGGKCKNGNPGVNCNIYTDKPFVWLNGGPAANGLGPDGQYFFVVLEPGGQPDPNDGSPHNLSTRVNSTNPGPDAYTNRTFTVTNGEVSAYTGTHDFDSGATGSPTIDGLPPFIRLFPYADTTNPGGVYIMAICYLGPSGTSYPVVPRDCKYDAFKVQKSTAQVQAVLSGMKYLDATGNGQFDTGEQGLKNWVIQITGSDGTNTTVKTDSSGNWTYTTAAHSPTTGTTTYTISEVLQSGWTETGNTVDQTMAAGGATASLSNFVYTVTVPNDAISAVSDLFFGNVQTPTDGTPPSCALTAQGTDAQGRSFIQVTVQDTGSGLKSVVVTEQVNLTYTFSPNPFTVGTTNQIVYTATKTDQSQSSQFALQVTDVAGNVTNCDPVDALVVRDSGKPATAALTGIPQTEGAVTLTNGAPGVSALVVTVNGQEFKVSGLAANEARTIDIAAAMRPGNDNVVTVAAYGAPGASVRVLVWDGVR